MNYNEEPKTELRYEGWVYTSIPTGTLLFYLPEPKTLPWYLIPVAWFLDSYVCLFLLQWFFYAMAIFFTAMAFGFAVNAARLFGQ